MAARRSSVLGVGIDLVELDEFQAMLKRRGARFLDRVFTQGEIDYCRPRAHPQQHYAARFAAKEAAFKALGTGWAQGVDWRDVEVVGVFGKRPTLALHGAFLRLAGDAGAIQAQVSLTHTTRFASAVVILIAAAA